MIAIITKYMSAPKNSPLVDYALRGLERCWLPEFGRWSHIYHLDNRDPPNETVPESDVFYTLNVLLGLARVPHVPPHIDVREHFSEMPLLLVTLPVSKYALGVALWTAGRTSAGTAWARASSHRSYACEKDNWRQFRAQDLGMILMGVTTQAKLDPKRSGPSSLLNSSHFWSTDIIRHRACFTTQLMGSRGDLRPLPPRLT